MNQTLKFTDPHFPWEDLDARTNIVIQTATHNLKIEHDAVQCEEQ
jgi:hypothetical protein